MSQKLSKSFFQDDDVAGMARALLGCRLWSRINDEYTAGIILETEAYDGLTDRASHAFGGRRTPRTEIFYHPGGVAYIYLCYGIHELFNIITGPKDIPHAVLIRAIAPCVGIETILRRRKHSRLQHNTASGPGLVSQALGITRDHNGLELDGDKIWLTQAKRSERPDPRDITASPRVGIDYAGKDAQRPWRFRMRLSSQNRTPP